MPLDARFSFMHEHFVALIYSSCSPKPLSQLWKLLLALSEFSDEANGMSGYGAQSPGFRGRKKKRFSFFVFFLSLTGVVEALCIQSVTPSGVLFRGARGLIRTKAASVASQRSSRTDRLNSCMLLCFGQC